VLPNYFLSAGEHFVLKFTRSMQHMNQVRTLDGPLSNQEAAHDESKKNMGSAFVQNA